MNGCTIGIVLRDPDNSLYQLVRDALDKKQEIRLVAGEPTSFGEVLQRFLEQPEVSALLTKEIRRQIEGT